MLVGPPGSDDVVLGSPIILYDHPEIAEQSAGALFDSTEIDEILTLRVMTMTDAEKAEARATDPRAAEIIDRCDQMSPETLQHLHGVLRDPHRADVLPATGADLFDTDDVPWWDPAADESVQPGDRQRRHRRGERGKGSLVRVHPSRRADAQDLFFAGQVARVTAVLSDVDGEHPRGPGARRRPRRRHARVVRPLLLLRPRGARTVARSTRGESPMKVIGIVTTVTVAVVAVGLLVVLVMSIPDIRRYLKIRAM